MGTKVTSSSGSVLEEPEIQKLQMQAKIFKENSLNKLNELKSTTQLLEKENILYQQAFAQLFGDSVRTFKFQLSQHMNNLETLLNAETLHEMDSKSASKCDQIQFLKAQNKTEDTAPRLGYSALTAREDYVYHKEKMMMCKQAEQGIPLQVDWLEDTDEKIDEQELEAHYSFMAKIQEVLPEESSSTEQPECADERDALANLIANLTLDTGKTK
ncbi:hypothetical protein Tco_0041141 [Tanacetum coccineum]